MDISFSLIRAFFFGLCLLIMTTYITTMTEEGPTSSNLIIGLIAGLAFASSLMAIDSFFKRFSLHAFNIVMLGLFFGYLMGEALFLIVNNLLEVSRLKIDPATKTLLKTALFLITSYIGVCMTKRASSELSISVPFVKFKPMNDKKKDLLIDPSILQDSRFIDLAASGLLNNHLIIPRFILKELYKSSENEMFHSKAKQSLEIYKKLENMPNLDLRYTDTDFHDIQDPSAKLIRLARLLDANIITSDVNRIQQSTIENVCIININMLANALKPISQGGEFINIRIQHSGKGPRQGVGYIEDGTMVVINGGEDHIGKTIKAQVVSVKHTTSGRMIFCNSAEESLLSEQESAHSVSNLEQKSYCTL